MSDPSKPSDPPEPSADPLAKIKADLKSVIREQTGIDPDEARSPEEVFKSKMDEVRRQVAKSIIAGKLSSTVFKSAADQVLGPRQDPIEDQAGKDESTKGIRVPTSGSSRPPLLVPKQPAVADEDTREDGYSDAEVRDYFERKYLPRDHEHSDPKPDVAPSESYGWVRRVFNKIPGPHWLKWAEIGGGGAVGAVSLKEYLVAEGFLIFGLICCITQVCVWTVPFKNRAKSVLAKVLLGGVTIALFVVFALTIAKIKGQEEWSNWLKSEKSDLPSAEVTVRDSDFHPAPTKLSENPNTSVTPSPSPSLSPPNRKKPRTEKPKTAEQLERERIQRKRARVQRALANDNP